MIDLLEERESVLRAQIASIENRLATVSATLAEDGPTVTGSRGQTRAHGLLPIETALQKERARTYQKLASVVQELEGRRAVERANAAFLNALGR
jgi:ParB-like chromosome segregation protein Spo0J